MQEKCRLLLSAILFKTKIRLGEIKVFQRSLSNDLYFGCYKALLDVFHKTPSKLEREHIYKAKNVGFRVHDQCILTYEQRKLVLSAYYIKCYMLTDVFIQDPQSFDHSEFFCKRSCLSFLSIKWNNKKTWGLEVTVYLATMQAIIKFTGKAHKHLKMQLMQTNVDDIS